MKEAADPAVERWYLLNEDECALTSIALAELSFGIARLADGNRRRTLEAKLTEWRVRYSERTIGFGATAAMYLQRYFIIVFTAFGGAWTLIVGVMALLGDRTALAAAAAGDVWLYSTPILHSSAAASQPTTRRVLQIDYAAEPLPDGLEWLGV